MLYRILRNLSTGPRRGDIVDERHFKNAEIIDILIGVNAIAPVSGPPLTELPGWERRAQILAEHGIENTMTFIETDNAALMGIFNYKREATIEKMKEEVRKGLGIMAIGYEKPKPRRR